MVAIGIGIGSLAIGVSNLVWKSLDKIWQNDGQARETFVKSFLEQSAQQYPNYNVVLAHTAHRVSGEYVHEHFELGMTVGTCGYEIYFALKGRPFEFELQGDGGWINWGFNGEFNRDGGKLVASAPQVTVYDDSQYGGVSQTLRVGRYDWGQIRNDSISSLRVPAGMRVTLYSDTHFGGASKTFTQDTPYVGDDFNDKTSSIIVESESGR
jgi:hypothetical protein